MQIRPQPNEVDSGPLDPEDVSDVATTKRQSAKISRLLDRCRAHGLIAKGPAFRTLACTRMDEGLWPLRFNSGKIQFPAAYTKLPS
jgi:hypothetical protein